MQRYDASWDETGYFDGISPTNDGEYVLHSEAQAEIVRLHAELTAEKALADRLHFALTNHENADINAVFAAYRKARGL